MDMKYVNSVWRPLKTQSVNHRKQKIYISSENKRHAQEGSCLETGFFEILRVQYSLEVGNVFTDSIYLFILFTALQVTYLLVELLASQYPMNLDIT